MQHETDTAESLAVVIPVHDEEATIPDLIEELGRDVVAKHHSAVVIVVDDASTDSTPAILARRAAADPWLHVEHSERNRGHGPTVRRGLDLALADWIFELDSDGQFVVSEFWSLWERRTEADVVIGVRTERRDSLHRRLLSRGVALVTSVLAGRRLRDPNDPFRLLRREVWEDVRAFVPEDVGPIHVLFSVGAVKRGWRVAEVPISHLPRPSGHSTLRAFRLARFCARGLWQLLTFRIALSAAGSRSGRRSP
jgi:glycosyltransferase involved in cell wall biosynthesis